MKRSLHIILSLLAFMLPLAAGAQSVKIICQPQVIQGQKFQIAIRVTDMHASTPKAPELKNCQFIYGPGTSTMQSMQYINGKTTSSFATDYTFTYQATKAGRVTIPAVTVTEGGKKYTAQARSFEILPPDRSQQHNNPYYDEPDPVPTASNRTQVRPNDLIVTTTLSKANVYEQEAVIATIKVYTKHPITSFRATTLPVFEGFLSEELPVNESARIEHFRGENYYSAILKRCLLYPKKSGVLKINSGRYDVTLITYETITQGFFQTQREVPVNITTTSNETSVKVLPLPSPRPEGFNGAVGVYNVTTSLEPQILRTNEPATYTFKISGTGNLKNLIAPEVPMPQGIEAYTPEASTDAKFNGSDMTGTFTATYNLVPEHEGQTSFPAWKFVYFDPTTRQYVTVDIPAYDRKVARGSAPQQNNARTDIDKMTDIEHIVPVTADSLSHENERTFGSWTYILCYLIVIAGLFTAAIVYRRQINFRADIAGRRTARASRVANRRLRQARQAMNRHRNTEFYALLAQALWGYISDKLRIPASALTRDNIADKLNIYGAEPALIDKTIAILDDCEMARFTPEHSDTEVSTLYSTAADVISALEAVKTKNVKKDIPAQES